MILVTGSTGQLGGGAIQHLLNKGVAASEIAALARDPQKAEALSAQGVDVRQGDYLDKASMVKAFAGIDKLFLVSSSSTEGRDVQHINAIDAAKEAGVKHIVYTSFIRKNETSSSPIFFLADSHMKTEAHLKASGIAYTIMMNSYYADFLPMMLGEQVLETGVYYPAKDGKAAFTLRDDMAEAAANILTSEGHEGKEYIIASNVNLSFQDIADTLSEVAGKTVPYTSPDGEEYVKTLIGAGVPEEYAGMFAAFGQAFYEGEFEVTHTDLPTLLNREPASVKELLKATYKS